MQLSDLSPASVRRVASRNPHWRTQTGASFYPSLSLSRASALCHSALTFDGVLPYEISARENMRDATRLPDEAMGRRVPREDAYHAQHGDPDDDARYGGCLS